jgi:hypothetical protein
MAVLLSTTANAQGDEVATLLTEHDVSYSVSLVQDFEEPRLAVGGEQFIGVEEIRENIDQIQSISHP